MKEKKIKIKELAHLAKISEPTLKRLRVMESNPTLDVLIKLSGALCVGLDELIQESFISNTHYQNPEEPSTTSEKSGKEELHPLNKSGLSVIDTETFTLVLKEIVIALNNHYFQINYKEIIDFCYDVYNNIITTSTDKSGKIAMIQLAITSLKRGNLLKEEDPEDESKSYKTV